MRCIIALVVALLIIVPPQFVRPAAADPIAEKRPKKKPTPPPPPPTPPPAPRPPPKIPCGPRDCQEASTGGAPTASR